MTRVALITVADTAACSSQRLRRLLPYLEEAFEVQVFVGPRGSATEFASRPAKPAAELDTAEYERILYFVEDAAEQAFMVPMIQSLGGLVVLHDWNLGRVALELRPELGRPGWRGHLAAWREGGRGAWRARRRAEADSWLAEHPLNRSVVRHADGFVVPRAEWRRSILEDRNAHTPIAVVPWSRDEDDASASAPRFLEALKWLPVQRSNRKSLIRSAIDEADRVRAERDLAEREG